PSARRSPRTAHVVRATDIDASHSLPPCPARPQGGRTDPSMRGSIPAPLPPHARSSSSPWPACGSRTRAGSAAHARGAPLRASAPTRSFAAHGPYAEAGPDADIAKTFQADHEVRGDAQGREPLVE